MLEKLEALDARIIGLSTRFSHWFQRLTGRTNFFIAKIGVGMTALSVFGMIINYWKHIFFTISTDLSTVMTAFIVLTWLAMIVYSCDDAENKLYSNSSPQKVRYLGLEQGGMPDNAIWRLFLLTFTFLSIPLKVYQMGHIRTSYYLMEILTGLFFTMGMTVASYFLVIDPLPPAESRVKEWIDNLSTAFARPVPATIPVKK